MASLPILLFLLAAEVPCTGPSLDLDAIRMSSSCDVDHRTRAPWPEAGQLTLEVPGEQTVARGESIDIPVLLRNTGEEPATLVVDPGGGRSVVIAGVTRDGQPVAQDYCPISSFGMARAVRLTLDPGGAATATVTWWANNANESPETMTLVGCKNGRGLQTGVYELVLRLPGTREQPGAPSVAVPVVVR